MESKGLERESEEKKNLSSKTKGEPSERENHCTGDEPLPSSPDVGPEQPSGPKQNGLEKGDLLRTRKKVKNYNKSEG